MKNIRLLILIFGLIFCSCNQSGETTSVKEKQLATTQISTTNQDREEIQNLIRQVLKWADSENSINLLPMLTDSKDSIYIGFDLDKHEQNLKKLKSTDFFATEFINNYNQIILTLDKGLKNGDYEQWLVGDLPTFIFANDVDPWCECQDNLEWNTVEVKIILLDNEKGDLEWYWGNLSTDTHPSWKGFSYSFKVKKENNKWKISYLHGFDFKESTRKEEKL